MDKQNSYTKQFIFLGITLISMGLFNISIGSVDIPIPEIFKTLFGQTPLKSSWETIIITHGNLAIELKSSLEHIIGPQKNLETISIGYEDDVNKRKDEIKELINKVDTGKGVILLTDMFGNTPSNLVISLIEENSKIMY